MSNDVNAQVAALLAQMQAQANTSAMSDAVSGSLIPQLSNMLKVHNGPRGKNLVNTDQVTQIRRRQIRIDTAQGDSIEIKEETAWFGDED